MKPLFGHPAALFVLFFTEMWERFSYYGMRAILVLFLTSSLAKGGWNWSSQDALELYGWYTGLVYLFPILGGYLADRYIGTKAAVAIGAFLMTLGHVAMAFEIPLTFYLGLSLLIMGNGVFKPNLPTIVGSLYTALPDKKDAAYTIYYMGVNAGAFLGILICGYLGEQVGWSYGFGAAGIFMFFGMLQFWFARKMFPEDKRDATKNLAAINSLDQERPAKEGLTKIERDRLIVIAAFAFFTIFFWVAFEQAGGTMTLFARDFTDRTLSGSGVGAFQIISFLITIIPMVILTIVIIMLAKSIVKKYPLTILFTSLSFIVIWGIVIWINKNTFSEDSAEVPASWFGTLNSFFIIAFAPLFSRIWERMAKTRLNPSGPVKLSFGLILMGLGFVFLAYGARNIAPGQQIAAVSMIWLIAAYLLHTLGELCLSPVGMSFVNKLSPARLLGMMFGIWYLSNFAANLLAGQVGSAMDKIADSSSMASFFMIFVYSSFAAAGILLLLNRPLVKLMHGVK